MIFLLKNKPYKASIFLLIIALLISSYFMLQLFRGQYSYHNLQGKYELLNELILTFEKNQFAITNYESKIKSLNPDQLDLDSLEVEMRDKLLYTKPNEVMLIIPDDQLD
jgi:cell division protein FtsB